ncbi:MAG: hypothetical protein RBR87_14645 [Bacteroidales bacterium]|jgi:hypothetical protein|nr:hypothetical protein [Bacteroidales bacterium]
MKIKIVFYLSILVLLIVGFSCSKKQVNQFDVQIENAEEQVDNTSDLLFYGGDYNMYKDNRSFTIIRIRLWRKSYNCMRKLGICEVQILPDLKNNSFVNEGREIDIPYDASISNDGIYLYFSQDVSEYSVEELTLYVDDNIPIEDELNVMTNALYIPQGTYNYSSSIGDFGGYFVPTQD